MGWLAIPTLCYNFMEGETNDNPGYAVLRRLFAIGYIKGLREAVCGRDTLRSDGSPA